MRMKLFGCATLLALTLGVVSACGCEHEVVVDEAVEPTCVETGLTEGSHCSLCAEVLTEQKTIPANGHTEVVEEAVEATCTIPGLTEGKYCSECDEVFTEQGIIPAKGHTTESGTCERCGEERGEWIVKYYVDQFNDPTDEAYISNKNIAIGTFSNSATTKSDLEVVFLIEEDSIEVVLYEYGSYRVKNSSSKNLDYYDVTMKAGDGTKVEFSAVNFWNGDRLYFLNSEAVIAALRAGGTVSFYIEEQDNSTTNYLFKVDCSNFAELYDECFPKVVEGEAA